MRASELKAGWTFAVAFDRGDDFMTSFAGSARITTSGRVIPMFLVGFADVDIVGTCDLI